MRATQGNTGSVCSESGSTYELVCANAGAELSAACLLVCYMPLAHFFAAAIGRKAFHEFLKARLTGKQTRAVHLGARAV